MGGRCTGGRPRTSSAASEARRGRRPPSPVRAPASAPPRVVRGVLRASLPRPPTTAARWGDRSIDDGAGARTNAEERIEQRQGGSSSSQHAHSNAACAQPRATGGRTQQQGVPGSSGFAEGGRVSAVVLSHTHHRAAGMRASTTLCMSLSRSCCCCRGPCSLLTAAAGGGTSDDEQGSLLPAAAV